MPMRILRATSAFAGGHITNNLWLSTAIFAGLTVLAGLLMQAKAFGTVGLWGDAAALFACIAGILVMLQSQVGYVSSHVVDADDDA